MRKPKNPHLKGIDTVIIRVTNLDEPKKWYQEKLGLNPVFEDEQTGIVVFETGSSTSLTIWKTEKKFCTMQKRVLFPFFLLPMRRQPGRISRKWVSMLENCKKINLFKHFSFMIPMEISWKLARFCNDC